LAANIGSLTGLTFLIIYMLYVPCVATVTTIIEESNSKLFGAVTVMISLSVAFALGIIVYHTGQLLMLITNHI
jgi:ferrous iron transport protein B